MKGRNAACMRILVMSIKKKMTYFCNLSRWGIMKTKKLPPSWEATHNTINILIFRSFALHQMAHNTFEITIQYSDDEFHL